MTNKETVLDVLEIEKTIATLSYNIFEKGSNEIMQDSRLKEFAIYHKLENSGIVIEYVKGKLYVHYFFNPKMIDKIDYEDINNNLPLRFKEVIAEIKKLSDNSPISTSFLKNIIELSLKSVPKNKYDFIKFSDSRNSVLLYNIKELLSDKNKHTFVYINKPLFGKINRHFRASVKRDIPSIREIIDAEK